MSTIANIALPVELLVPHWTPNLDLGPRVEGRGAADLQLDRVLGGVLEVDLVKVGLDELLLGTILATVALVRDLLLSEGITSPNGRIEYDNLTLI